MTTVVAILVIAGLSMFAMHKGIDGKVLAVTIAAIAGLGGYGVKEFLSLIKK